MALPLGEPTCLCHLVPRGGCRQGRACPIRECEYAHDVPHSENFPTPKGKPVNDYRLRSGAWTGYAPRTTEERWPTPPRTVSTRAGWLSRLIARLFGR